jgi:hypothetical protein
VATSWDVQSHANAPLTIQAHDADGGVATVCFYLDDAALTVALVDAINNAVMAIAAEAAAPKLMRSTAPADFVPGAAFAPISQIPESNSMFALPAIIEPVVSVPRPSGR